MYPCASSALTSLRHHSISLNLKRKTPHTGLQTNRIMSIAFSSAIASALSSGDPAAPSSPQTSPLAQAVIGSVPLVHKFHLSHTTIPTNLNTKNT